MRAKLWMVAGAAAMWACGGATFTGSTDGGTEGGSGSGSGSSGGGSGSSGSSGSSSGSSGGSSGSGGGSGSGSGSSSGGSGSSSGSSSGGLTGPSCPATTPSGGTACPVPGMECEYGDDPNPECNDIETCDSNGLWSYPAPVPACPPGTCPATYAQVPQGQGCTPEGLDCAYAEGQCNCAPTVPVSGPDPVWQCSMPAAGCPEPRPRIGSSCTQPGLSCDYGSCTGGVLLQCTDGSWQMVDTPCPI
jgi:hypothetical protein